MDFKAYVNALRRHWWIILAALAAGAAGAAVLFLLTPSTYAASVTFYVAAPVTDGTNPQSAAQYAQARVNSYVILMSSDRVANAVVDRTGVALTPAQVAARITADAKLNTVVMTATVHDSTQARADIIAQGLADTFNETAARLDNAGSTGQKVYVSVVSGPSSLGVVAPEAKVYGGIGLAAGLVAGLVLVILLELLDNTVRTPESAAAVTEAPLIGSVPRDEQLRKNVVALSKPGSARAESFRQLRTNLQFIDAVNPARVLMVTSAVAGEGKSQVAVGLSAAFAEAESSVVLLEADLRRPGLAAAFGMEPQLGLTNVLVGQQTLDQVIQPVIPRVDVVPAGSFAPNPSELLGGDRFAEILATLRSRYDRIIIDTPPVLPVTDAAVISPLIDGIVFVVRAGKTSPEQVRTASIAVRAGGARLLGVVLNQVRQHGRHHYYMHSDEQIWPSATMLSTKAQPSGSAEELDSPVAEQKKARPEAGA